MGAVYIGWRYLLEVILAAHNTENTAVTIEQVQQKLRAFKPQKNPERLETKRSAVTLLLHEFDGDVCVLMIERAKREGDPWSGHMAFPGGRVDPEDAHSYDAALRECEEEVGLTVDSHGGLIGRLSELPTHWRNGLSEKMYVTPFVFALASVPELKPNYEVADTVWVPLSYLAELENRDEMVWDKDDMHFELPCYYFQGKTIWGLSLGMLDELLLAVGLASFPNQLQRQYQASGDD